MDLESQYDQVGPTPDDHTQIIANNGSASPLNSPPEDGSTQSQSASPTPKGYGLKKWRRIKRTDVLKDTCAAVDTSKFLKRHLPGNLNSTKPHHNTNTSDASPLVFNNVDAFGISDSTIALASLFAAATDSDNSEDRSSKSSTAATAPKPRFDHKTKLKAVNAKNSPTASQKGKMETTKKPRGIDKENSHSSIESDSRSSNFFFMHTTNGKQIGRSLSYDGEDNSEDAHANEQHLGDQLQTAYSKDNAGQVEDSQHDEEKNQNNHFSTHTDPLLQSILTLQSVQEALDKGSFFLLTLIIFLYSNFNSFCFYFCFLDSYIVRNTFARLCCSFFLLTSVK